jgi:glycosyltransferase involved in cell wall biosynthesis
MYRHSGIGRYLRTLFPLLLPRLAADRVRVLGRRELFGEAPWMAEERVELIESSTPIYSAGEQMLAVRGAYRGSDLLWVPHYNAPLYYGGDMVVTMHDVAPLAMPEILSNGIKRRYAKMLIERAAKQAAAILCVSEFTRSELATRLHVPAEKMIVTPLGLDSGWPISAAAHVEADGLPYLLYVGNVKPNKNLGLLLRAFAAVRDRLPHRLVLVGRMRGFGTGDDAVIAQAEAMGDRVRFAGEVSDETLCRFYAGADALVMPSRYEGFGLPLLEAMQMSCPVLSSTAGSLMEVGGDAAIYFDPDSETELKDCLLTVSDREAMQRMRERGRERVAKFSLERCAELTAGVMNRLMRGEAL